MRSQYSRVARLIALFATVVAGGCGGDGGTATVEVASLRFVLQPITPSAGVPFTVTVELLSAAGARITSATHQVTLSVTGGAVLAGPTTVAAVAGLATFNATSVNTVGQNFQLSARVGDVSTTSSSFNVAAGPASTTTSTLSANPASPAANVNSTLTFVFRDALGNPIAGALATFSSNTAGTTFTPPNATTDNNGGVSTVFRAQSAGSVLISANIAGTNITFPASITVGGSAPTLRFATQPVAVSPNAPFSVAVEFVDGAGQRMTTATGQVTLTMNASGLQGTTTTNAIAGLATFNNLTIGAVGVGFVLTATSGSMSVQSNGFNVAPNICTPGALTIGTPANAVVSAGSPCVLNGHTAASLRFTVPQGNAIAVSAGATGSLTPEFAFTADPPAADALIFVPSAQTPTREWLIAPGTYLATVSATNGATGTFTITTNNNGAGAAGCIQRVLINANATYTGQSLANSTPSECLDPAGSYFEDRFLIYDSRACTIRMSSAAFDPFMSIRDQSLAVITDDDDSGGNRDALITMNPCRQGSNPYIIGASSFVENDTGPYTLTVSFAAAGPGQPSQTVTIAPSPQLQVTTMREALNRRVKR